VKVFWRPRTAAWLLAFALAVALAHGVYQIPIQVSDSLEVIVEAEAAPSTTDLLRKYGAAGTLRPMRYLQARVLVAAARRGTASFHAWFRGIHALLTVALILLFAAAARVRSWSDVAALGFALTVLTGLHTFRPMLRESFPVNHFLEVAAIVLLVVVISQRRPRLVSDICLIVLLALSLLLVESAVLVWVTIAACALLRMPGIRLRTAIAATAVLIIYAGARQYFEIGTPGVGSHGSGYGAVFYEPDELIDRFGSQPLPFFAYNFAAGVLSVLFSEPQSGVYSTLVAIDRGEISPVLPIGVASSGIVTALLFWRGRQIWKRRAGAWSEDDRLLLLSAVVMVVSGVLCLAYVKDDILSVAGVLYALSAFIATRSLFDEIPRARRAHLMAAIAVIAFLVAAPLWGFRAIGTHFDLRRTAFMARNDWTSVTAEEAQSNATTRLLKNEVLRRKVTNSWFLPRRGDRYWLE
jgi:hypothetical protein